jgi:hypothetical protein
MNGFAYKNRPLKTHTSRIADFQNRFAIYSHRHTPVNKYLKSAQMNVSRTVKQYPMDCKQKSYITYVMPETTLKYGKFRSVR